MTRQKAQRYAEALGIPNLTISQWKWMINECIFSERDRYIVTRYLIDDIPASALVDEVIEKFPATPLEEQGVRRAIKRCMNELSKYT